MGLRTKYHSTPGIIGRGTVTRQAKFEDGLTYAVKVSWPEEGRPNEAEVLQAAMEKAEGDADITNHIPRVFATQDFLYRTGTVRKALGIPESKNGHPDSRVLRVSVFPTFDLLPPSKTDSFIPGLHVSAVRVIRLAYAHSFLNHPQYC